MAIFELTPKIHSILEIELLRHWIMKKKSLEVMIVGVKCIEILMIRLANVINLFEK